MGSVETEGSGERESVVFLYDQTMAWLPAFGIFNVHTDGDASDCTRGLYRHCVGESALEFDSGANIPCRIGDSNRRQQYAWIFSGPLYLN